MRKVLKWAAYGVGGAVVLLLVVVAALYARGTWILETKWDVAGIDIPVPGDSASIAQGRHVAKSRGCLNCHSALAQGQVFFDEPRVARIVAPNIARLAREYSTAQFERAVRRGVRPSGTGVAIMPSAMFSALTDADLGSVIAYLRSLTPAKDSFPPRDVRIMGRIGLATGKFNLAPQLIQRAVDGAQHTVPAPGDTVALGRYIARTSCTECHGLDLRGDATGGGVGTPSLVGAATYTPEQFAHLMRTGEPTGGRKLTLMAEVAQGRFSNFTDEEISALHRYLQTLAKEPPRLLSSAGK
jgi:mono/diheme cytochrome c family protein